MENFLDSEIAEASLLYKESLEFCNSPTGISPPPDCEKAIEYIRLLADIINKMILE